MLTLSTCQDRVISKSLYRRIIALTNKRTLGFSKIHSKNFWRSFMFRTFCPQLGINKRGDRKFSMAYMAANCAKLSKAITFMIAKMKSVSHSSAPKACCSSFMLKWLFCNQNCNLGFKISIFFEERQKYVKGPFSWTIQLSISVDETELKSKQ